MSNLPVVHVWEPLHTHDQVSFVHSHIHSLTQEDFLEPPPRARPRARRKGGRVRAWPLCSGSRCSEWTDRKPRITAQWVKRYEGEALGARRAWKQEPKAGNQDMQWALHKEEPLLFWKAGRTLAGPCAQEPGQMQLVSRETRRSLFCMGTVLGKDGTCIRR